jgi:ATP-binding cassette subfamily B protein
MREAENRDDEEKVLSALKKAGLYDKVADSENGVHTNLTREFDDEGILLSGGESQKIALARVFAYEDAEIVILDEPSSALDPIAEYEINDRMFKAAQDSTIILISHRLSTTRAADKIYCSKTAR